MMKILVYTDLNAAQQTQLQNEFAKDIEFIFRNSVKDDLQSAFQSASIILGNPPANWFTEVPENLSFWQLDSAGFDQYQNVKLKNIVVANMGDFFSIKCAETIVAGILAFYRHIHELVRLQTEKKWIGKPLRYKLDLLSEKNIIILGAGSIAQSIEKILSGFNCSIKITARKNPRAQIHSYDNLLSELQKTDLVINTLPGKANKYVSADFFNAMQKGSLYASIGRGNTTDEEALLDALTTRKISGAVLDVTEQEPLPQQSKLWDMQNVILTQHTGGGYKEEDEGKVKFFISNVKRFLNGEEVQHRVNLEQGY